MFLEKLSKAAVGAPAANAHFVRTADVWQTIVFADATNVGFDGPQRRMHSTDEGPLRAVCVDKASAKLRIGVLRRRKSA